MMIRNHNTQRSVLRRRRGVLLLDLLLGIATLAVTMAGTMVLIAGLRKQRQVHHEYFLATQHLANVLEEIDVTDLTTVDWTEFENDALGKEALRDLPGVTLTIEMDHSPPLNNSETGNARGPGERQDERYDATENSENPLQNLLPITCSLTWPSGNNRLPHHTSLTMWKSLTAAGPPAAIRDEATP